MPAAQINLCKVEYIDYTRQCVEFGNLRVCQECAMGRKGPKSREKDIVVQRSNDEVLIYDLRSNKALCLNETSSIVWDACDGNRDRDEIRNFVSAKLGKEVNGDLIWLALDQLKKEELISSDAEIETKFEGLSRREVIRKIGIGSMIALPVIASMVAPQAAYAISVCPTTNPPGCPTTGGGRAPGCGCSGNGNCTSGTCIPAAGGAIACCS